MGQERSTTNVPRFTPEELAKLNESMRGEKPENILAWGIKTFPGKLMMATAFGVEGCCIIHMIAQIDKRVRIINLETGYQFKETLLVREQIKERYGIEVEYIYPEKTVTEYEKEHGGPLYDIRPDQCCYDRKILPLRKAVLGYEAWISAIRRDQTDVRKSAEAISWDTKFQLVKINPLLDWTIKDVWSYVMKNQIPYNKLHDLGYPSIGCEPCTRAVQDGEDERSGRWSGKTKKECGLHVVEHEQGSGI